MKCPCADTVCAAPRIITLYPADLVHPVYPPLILPNAGIRPRDAVLPHRAQRTEYLGYTAGGAVVIGGTIKRGRVQVLHSLQPQERNPTREA
jgi:hypothetical protein